ncbi:MAG: hypothetical protein HC820_09350 [Hydrococcus sp. RM1_1_31]|nr:hypothetical protein [Hydrococcus sp. RM1_1_31]
MELESSQHLFNTTSTTIQQPLNVELLDNVQIVEQIRDTATQEFIQHTERNEGERGCVEQTQFNDVLQNEQIVILPTTTEDTACQTNSLVPISQQKAFNQKYQPVEVLNSEGEWISGYFVYKCLIVANLEGVERKYALVDELGGKYAFWGEIRLPRVR